jgi:AraC-like DNA-binding protein/quercetin dioxygenase-like cupin family protein
MNQEQESYISLIKQTSKETIRIKKTGWEEIKLPGHAHEKCQIIYTLSGTLHVQIGSTSYFVPEKHIAWIPGSTEHELSSKNRQVSLVIFYLSLDADDKDTALKEFSIYHTNSFIAENLKFIASKGTEIEQADSPDLYAFALSFFKLLPSISQDMGFLLKMLAIPNDARLHPILAYLQEHLHENLKMPQLAARFGFSVRNLSRLFNESGIRFSYYVNNLRIMRAIELFADGGRTMQQIAYEVGFATPNHFNRVFRQITGVSPNAFVKND